MSLFILAFIYFNIYFIQPMPIAIGLKTNTHVLILGETVFGESIIKVKEDENRSVQLGNVVMHMSGKQTDEFRLRSYITEYSKLIGLKYARPLTPDLVSDFVGTYVHSKLRSGPLNCSTIIGGIGNGETDLYCVDSYGARHMDNFVTIGYGLYFLYGIFDMYYNKDMNLEESIFFLKLCVKTLKEKLVLETDKWNLTVISIEGEIINKEF